MNSGMFIKFGSHNDQRKMLMKCFISERFIIQMKKYIPEIIPFDGTIREI